MKILFVIVQVLALSSACQAELKKTITKDQINRVLSNPAPRKICINGTCRIYATKQELVDKIRADIARNKAIDRGQSFKLRVTITKRCR